MPEELWIGQCEALVRGFPDELATQVTSLLNEAASMAKMGNLTAAADFLETARQTLIKRNHFRRFHEDIWVFTAIICSIREQSSEEPVPRAFQRFMESKPTEKLGSEFSPAQKSFWYGLPSAHVDNELHIPSSTASDIPESIKNCFIATAAYGSPMASEVETLRNFRDTVLLQHQLGKIFVKWYYKTSPQLARWIAPRKQVRKLVRLFLAPLLFLIGKLPPTLRNNKSE
jgi:hypothetical protein